MWKRADGSDLFGSICLRVSSSLAGDQNEVGEKKGKASQCYSVMGQNRGIICAVNSVLILSTCMLYIHTQCHTHVICSKVVAG